MVKIVKITTQKNKKNRFNIYIDRGNGEEYGFSVDEDIFIKYQLRKGMILEDEEINILLYQDEMTKAYHMTLNYLSYRMRSEKEVQDYLYLKGYKTNIVQPVIQKLKENQYLNDVEFAKAFVRSRMQNAVKGPLFIKQELMKKGVSLNKINEGLTEFSEAKQLEIASRFARKYAKQKKAISTYQLKQKIGHALLAKGFTQHIVQTVLDELTIEKSEEEKCNAVLKQGDKALKKYSRKYSGWELQQKVKQYLYQRGFSTEEIEVFWQHREQDHLEKNY